MDASLSAHRSATAAGCHARRQQHHHRQPQPRLLSQPLPASRRCCPAQLQLQPVRRAVVAPTAAAAASSSPAAPVDDDEATHSYEWSWQRGRSHLPDAATRFDAEHALPPGADLQAIARLLEDAAGACEALQQQAGDAADAADAAGMQALPSRGWVQAALAAAQPQLAGGGAPTAFELLQLLARLDVDPPAAWMGALLDGLAADAGQLSSRQLADAAWALSELRHTPSQPQWDALAAAAAAQLQEFYGPDLARFVCAAGVVFAGSGGSDFDGDGPAAAAAATPAAGSSGATRLALPAGWGDALLAEAEYQLTQFPADLRAYDLARLASGLADLRLDPGAELRRALLQAVYERTRSIEEKGAVDFALCKLEPAGKRSMHYDPRWTHEELKWLPRRERDKRRLIKEGWVRSQWGGWAS